MNKAILYNVTTDGLKALEDWDLQSMSVIAKLYEATVSKPLYICSFDYDITFRVWVTHNYDVLKIMQVGKKEGSEEDE